jgi:hypothetical protein
MLAQVMGRYQTKKQPIKIHKFHPSSFSFFKLYLSVSSFLSREVYHITIKKNAKFIGSPYFLHKANVKKKKKKSF